MSIRFYTFLFLFCAIACNSTEEEKISTLDQAIKTEMKFDQVKWRIKHKGHYSYRNQMLQDLMDNHNLKELKEEGILNLLGAPERTDNNHLFYRISQKRIGLFPLHTTTLVIKSSEDGTIIWVKIHK